MESFVPELYKLFPPGLAYISVPTSTRRAALAGLALYGPCRPRGVWLHRVAHCAVACFGPEALPGGRKPWRPPVEAQAWEVLLRRWRSEIGDFDSMAVYERRQAYRSGVMLLLLASGHAVAFVRLSAVDSQALAREHQAVSALTRAGPKSFTAPRPLAFGALGRWHYLATTPVFSGPHRVAAYPAVHLVVSELQAALEHWPRPAGVPDHWLPMHGDLTPWNLRELRDRSLALIDWEDVSYGPPGADEVLYRVTSSALNLSPLALPNETKEAIDFWRERISQNQNRSIREREVANRILDSLDAAPARAVSAARSRPRPRVLVFAYACEPGRGSEPGGGWGVVRMLSKFADCVVLVGPEHTSGINQWQELHGVGGIEFIEIGEPAGSSLAKVHRISWFMLYLAWLRRAYARGRRLHDERPFDAVCHASYSVYWLPTPATRFGVPCIWGPVGGAVTTPLKLWPVLGFKGIVDELLDFVSVRFSSILTVTRRTWRHATTRIVNNEETLGRLPNALRPRTRVLNHVLFADVPPIEPRARSSHILSFAPLESRKGVRLSIQALVHAPDDVTLVVEGDGPERGKLQRLAFVLGVESRVHFIGRVSRARLFEHLAECAAAVFTGLREEGGLSLAEAMLCGTPVIVLANGGARTVACAATDASRVALVPPAGVAQTARRLAKAMTRFSRNPPHSCSPLIDQGAAETTLRRAFEEALA